MSNFQRVNRQTVTALLALVLGRLAMLTLWTMLPFNPSQTVLLAVVVLDLVILAWQLWLIHRARRLSGTGFASLLMALMAVMAIAFALNTDMNNMASALRRDTLPPAPQALLRIEGSRAFLSGDIDFESYNVVQATLAETAGINTLVLDSTGGRIAAARGIARLVRETSLATHVSGICASACTVIFIAGTSRSMSDTARIGFHGYRLVSTVTTLDAQDEEQRDKAAFAAKGISAAFLERAFDVPHDEMWFPTRKTLQAAGVLAD